MSPTSLPGTPLSSIPPRDPATVAADALLLVTASRARRAMRLRGRRLRTRIADRPAKRVPKRCDQEKHHDPVVRAGARRGRRRCVYLGKPREREPGAVRLVSRTANEAIGGTLLCVQHLDDFGMSTANALSSTEGGPSSVLLQR